MNALKKKNKLDHSTFRKLHPSFINTVKIKGLLAFAAHLEHVNYYSVVPSNVMFKLYMMRSTRMSWNPLAWYLILVVDGSSRQLARPVKVNYLGLMALSLRPPASAPFVRSPASAPFCKMYLSSDDKLLHFPKTPCAWDRAMVASQRAEFRL